MSWSALHTGCPLPPGGFLLVIFATGWVDCRAIVRLEGLKQLKNLMISLGIEPATFRLVAQCLNQLCYRPCHSSGLLPNAVVRVRTRVRSCGICGGQSGTGARFLRVLRFPLSVLIPPLAPQSPSSIIWGWYNRPIMATVPSGLSLTPLRTMLLRALI
jgi:hypothetical protein